MQDLRNDGEAVEIVALSDEEIAALMAVPARRRLKKSAVTARLIEMGLAADVKIALDANPIAWARWFTPDWPDVFADDEGLLVFLADLGLTSEQIVEVTA